MTDTESTPAVPAPAVTPDAASQDIRTLLATFVSRQEFLTAGEKPRHSIDVHDHAYLEGDFLEDLYRILDAHPYPPAEPEVAYYRTAAGRSFPKQVWLGMTSGEWPVLAFSHEALAMTWAAEASRDVRRWVVGPIEVPSRAIARQARIVPQAVEWVEVSS